MLALKSTILMCTWINVKVNYWAEWDEQSKPFLSFWLYLTKLATMNKTLVAICVVSNIPSIFPTYLFTFSQYVVDHTMSWFPQRTGLLPFHKSTTCRAILILFLTVCSVSSCLGRPCLLIAGEEGPAGEMRRRTEEVSNGQEFSQLHGRFHFTGRKNVSGQ